jgi:hypothetical protein
LKVLEVVIRLLYAGQETPRIKVLRNILGRSRCLQQSRQRLVRLLVEEVRVDEAKGRLAIRLRDLGSLPFDAEEDLP